MKKTISIVLVLTMAASLFGCSAFQTDSKKKSKKGDFDEDEIVEVAENFAKAIKKADADSFEDLSSDKKAADVFDELVVGSDYDSDAKDIIGAVLDSMEYAVDEDSVDGDEDGAEVTVTFTMADYKKILKNGEFYDADDMVDAIEDSDKTTDVECNGSCIEGQNVSIFHQRQTTLTKLISKPLRNVASILRLHFGKESLKFWGVLFLFLAIIHIEEEEKLLDEILAPTCFRINFLLLSRVSEFATRISL